MKKILVLLIMMFYFMFNVKSQPDPCETPGPINGVLSYSETKEYISNYINFHSLAWDSYTRAYYINSKTFKFFADFFAANTQYKGLHFYFIIYQSKPSSEQRSMEQSLLCCVPVTEKIEADGNVHRIPDFEAFENYYKVWPDRNTVTQKELRSGIVCPNNCDGTIMSWDVDGHVFPRLTSATPDPNNRDRIIFSKKDIVKARNKRHIDDKKKDWNGFETKYVFMTSAAIDRLYGFIKNNSPITPLVGIYYGSYNQKMPTSYQEHPKQTTLIFIPMKKEEGGFIEPNICGYIQYVKSLNLSIEKAKNSENHGSLCPNYCYE